MNFSDERKQQHATMVMTINYFQKISTKTFASTTMSERFFRAKTHWAVDHQSGRFRSNAYKNTLRPYSKKYFACSTSKTFGMRFKLLCAKVLPFIHMHPSVPVWLILGKVIWMVCWLVYFNAIAPDAEIKCVRNCKKGQSLLLSLLLRFQKGNPGEFPDCLYFFPLWRDNLMNV